MIRRSFLKVLPTIPFLGLIKSDKQVPQDNLIFDEQGCAFGCNGVTTCYKEYCFCAEVEGDEIHWYPVREFPLEEYGGLSIKRPASFKRWFHSKGRLFWVSEPWYWNKIKVNYIYEFIVKPSWVEVRYIGDGHFDLQGDLWIKGKHND